MTTIATPPSIAYLAQGRLRVKPPGAAPRTLESAYANTLRERAVRAQQKHSWKGAGDGGSPYGGAVLWGKAAAAESGEVPLAITSLCGGRSPGGLVYSLESGSLCALLESGGLGAEEQRLWNDHRTRLRHLAVAPETGDLAFAVLHENGTANIGMKAAGESGIRELTEGDSFDTAPRWVPGESGRLVFQSAGVGRNREGHFLALGPFAIQQLDGTAGELTTRLTHPRYDYLAPLARPDGGLLYIRRPYAAEERFDLVRMLRDTVFFPFRLLFAGFQLLNFFTTLATGKPLTTAGGAKAREMNQRQMMIWGNLVRARQPARDEPPGVDLVPKSWELQELSAAGATRTLASGVLAYDAAPDGTIVYTNGNALFLLPPGGRPERLLEEGMIEQVFFVPPAAAA